MPRGAETVTSHGDFHAGELIQREGELVVLDVGEACRSAPARDLASYAAQAAVREGDDALEVLEGLLAGYDAERPDGLAWYLSASLLRRAERPFRSLDEDWPERIDALVETAERALGD